MLLSRWFFRWAHLEPVKALLVPEHLQAALKGCHLYRRRDLIAIVLERNLWRLGLSTWTRGALRSTLVSSVRAQDPGCTGQDTVLIWSHNDDFYGEHLRLSDDGFAGAEDEAGIVWAWIAHFLSKSASWQRAVTIEEAKREFNTWLKTSNTTLP